MHMPLVTQARIVFSLLPTIEPLCPGHANDPVACTSVVRERANNAGSNTSHFSSPTELLLMQMPTGTRGGMPLGEKEDNRRFSRYRA